MFVHSQLQQLSSENYGKESYASSSLGRQRITAMVQKKFYFSHRTISKLGIFYV
jgi:hypothetical protein